MDKITIPDFGTVSPKWLSHTLNKLSELQKIHRDIFSRFIMIRSILADPGTRTGADSLYHKAFAEGVIAEFKKSESLIFKEIYSELASITNAKGASFADISEHSEEDAANQMTFLCQEIERFKNLENNYNAAREALCNQDKELPHPLDNWIIDSFDKDFEREKAVFAERISHLIQNR